MNEQKDGTEPHGKSEVPDVESEALGSATPAKVEDPKPHHREVTPKAHKEVVTESQSLREVASPGSGGPRLPNRRLTLVLVFAILVVGVFAFISKSGSGGDDQRIQAQVAMSEEELRNIISKKNLTVYWAGPLEGAKYTISATTPGIVYLKYIPKGTDFKDTKIFFRTIGTYSMVNAFAVTQSTGAIKGNVGFTTADGYSAFYSLSRPTNIYLGVKKLNLQIEIFDAHADQALGLATVQGQIRKLV